MPRAKVQVAMANAVEKAGIEWPAFLLQLCCSVARLHLDKPASGPFGASVEGSVSGSRYEIRSRRLLRHPRIRPAPNR
jgi:hypothetical protein